MNSTPQWFDLAVRHHQAGNLQQAEQLYRQILQVDRLHVGALHLLGVIAHQAGRNDLAIDYVKQALRLKPDLAEAHSNLGKIFTDEGQLDEAVASLRESVRLKPDAPGTHLNLGNAFKKQGRLDEARASYAEAVRLKPDYAEACGNLGTTLKEQGKLEEAVVCYRQVLELRPDNAETYNNLGNALKEQGKLEEAVASYQQALAAKADYADAYNNLAIAFTEQGKQEESVLLYQKALSLKPDFAEAYSNLGNCLKDLGRLDEAITAYRAACQLKPDEARFPGNLIFALQYHSGMDAKSLYEECRSWNRRHAEPLLSLVKPHLNLRDPERQLRIGYVSPDFRGHATSFITVPLLQHHDHEQLEIYLYAEVLAPDFVTDRLRGYADVWRSTTGLTDEQVAELMRRDQIDILVDLTMHMARNRLLVFARKPAPVQIAWAAYPGTTGLSTIDYRLTDPYLDPPGLGDAFYSEESFRLPDTFWCYNPLTDALPVNELPAILNGFITFGCLNNFCKVNDRTLALWAKVLMAVPDSRLLLLVSRGRAREHVLTRLGHEGVAPSRVTFVAEQNRPDYLRTYNRIDLSVDLLPYNGHVTSLDAFWMGVPTITLVGETVVGRAGWSQLCNLDLKELAAWTPEQFVAIAAGLANDRPRLQELRATLRLRMRNSPLMDGGRFARHVERAYRQMWRRWCQTATNKKETPGISVSQTFDLALQHHRDGNLQQAEQLYRQILHVDPLQIDALHLIGVLAHQGGRSDLAIEYIRQALRLRPDFGEAHSNLGLALKEMGMLEEAVASMREAVRLRPELPEAYNNLGDALTEYGQPDEALTLLRQAVRMKPDLAEAHNSLGNAYKALRKLEEAEGCFRHAIRVKPDFAFAYNNLGNVLALCGSLEEAAVNYSEALRFMPDLALAHNNLGNALKDLGRLDEAMAAYSRAIELQPGAAKYHSNLVYTLLFHPRYDAATIYEEHRRWNLQHAEPLKKSIQTHVNRPDAERRLRIGYVSPNFCHHVMSLITIPLLENHDHRQLENFCYADVPVPDDMTERMRGHADVWRSTVGKSDAQVAELVRRDQIDILVDLNMHMADNRLLVFARKPAPVQVAWFAYPGTTGLTAIDYRLTDPYLDPPGPGDAYYSEESLRLPDTFWCYDPLTDQPLVNDLPALANGFITFGCLNNFCKVNDGTLALWAKVLLAVPQSRLFLLAPSGQARVLVLAKLAKEGIAAQRLEFLDKRPRPEYLKQYNRIDLSLDLLPYNGHVTSLDAFWMGVPTITLVGNTIVGRAGWSQLCNLSLRELAAQTPAEFVAIAVKLANDLPRLQELRASLRQRLRASPLMDGVRFARNMEQAYRHMWRRWCRERVG